VDTNASVREWVSDYYGKLLKSSEDLKTNACCATGAPPEWISARLEHVHGDVLERFYGCGFPIPQGLEGLRVLDLGCGTGRDVYVIAQLVGESGEVIGLDMTPEQLEVARRTQAWHADRFGFSKPNTRFLQGYIEDLAGAGIEDNSIDVIVSNCVVNLSPRKDIVLAEAYRVLAEGGEFYLSDVVVDRRLDPELANDPILHSECLGGAMYRADFEHLVRQIGFVDPRVMTEAPITIQNDEIIEKVGDATFQSVTYRLFKLPELEPRCEDYGEMATYKGGILGGEEVFWLDAGHAFEVGRPESVCTNTTDMLMKTRFADFFEIKGDRSVHLGAHTCGLTNAARDYADQKAPSCGPSCC
jgi:ubiquinone/menaquinone biosynthesis C-methylase UbiE